MYNHEYFKYQLLDINNQYISDLNNVEACKISYVALSNSLKQSATIDMTLGLEDAIDINNRIRVIHVLNGEESLLGTFLLSTPSERRYSDYKTISMQCYSVIWLLKSNKADRRYFVGKGTNVVNEVKRILDAMGITYSIPDSIKTTSTDREWEIGTPYTNICNDLLSIINYTSLYPLGNGNIAAREYVMPEQREIEFTYDETDFNNILESDMTNELDFYDVPNVFIRYVNDPSTPALYARYENNNPNSPTSIVNRPPNVNAEEILDASDVQTLMDICKKECSDATNKYNKIKFRTAINPKHLFMNCVYINLNSVIGKFIETRWDIDCTAGGVMDHEARMVVIV